MPKMTSISDNSPSNVPTVSKKSLSSAVNPKKTAAAEGSSSSSSKNNNNTQKLPSAIEFEPPLACVRRILKRSLPSSTNVGKDACAAFARACGIFIIYLTTCSNDFARENKRQTITANDVLAAVKELDFEDFTPDMLKFLESYRLAEKNKKSAKAAAVAAKKEELGDGDGDNDEDDEIAVSKQDGNEDDDLEDDDEDETDDNAAVEENDDDADADADGDGDDDGDDDEVDGPDHKRQRTDEDNDDENQ